MQSGVFFNPSAVTQFGGNAGLEVKFSMRPVKDVAASHEAGRAIYKNVEFVEINPIGETREQIVRIATADDKVKFAQAYMHFKATHEIVQGTPLEKWPMLDSAQVLELREFGIRSVEELAEADGHIQNFIKELALKAKNYLAYAADTQGAARLASELEAAHAEIRQLKEKIRKLEQAAKRGKDEE